MENEEYNTKALDTCFETINEKLDLIHTQVLKTNGRVSTIESWKDKITGGMIVITSILIPLIGLVIKLVWF